MSYKFKHPPAPLGFGPLPAGDYDFVVSEIDEPYFKNEKWILPVKLAIQPDGTPVFANPWTGQDKNGDERDGIAEFLVAVNRAPAQGEEPDWVSLVGAKGKCRLKTETAKMGALAGKEVNKVHYFHAPKQIAHDPAPSPPPRRRAPTKEELDQGPDDIPF